MTLKASGSSSHIKSTKKTTAKKKPVKLTETEIEKIKYSESIKKIFTLAGFAYFKSDGVDINFKTRVSEIDSIFIYKNIVVICEETTSSSQNVWPHLNNKNVLYNLIEANNTEFIQYLFSFYKQLDKFNKYPIDKYRLVIIYCSKYDIDATHKALVAKSVKFLDRPAFYYFSELTNIIKKSAKFELFKFFDLNFNDVGKAANKSSRAKLSYKAFMLPETASSFAKGYKVVTFYIDPKTLIKRAFVLRRSGWEDVGVLYQRPLLPKKVTKMREHLQAGKGVFVNNIIATLPAQTTFSSVDDSSLQTITPDFLNEIVPITITLPNEFNSICIIDGQHRLFSYHEGTDALEGSIQRLREIQHLLVTAVYYPVNTTREERINFEARLFVDINSTQTNAKSELIQGIKMIIEPFSKDAIAREIIQELNALTALKDLIAIHPYETNKLRPTTIVSYGLVPLVKLSGVDSLYSVWGNLDKGSMVTSRDFKLLKEYRLFAANEINTFVSAFQQVIRIERGRNYWKIGVTNSVITTMVVNGLASCLRLIVQNKNERDRDYYVECFTGVGNFDFSRYGGSKWNALGIELYNTYFK